MPPYQVSIIAGSIALKHSWFFQEDQNRGKPNWEHLNDELHVLITVEDTENRAKMKLQRAVDEVRKLLTVVRYLENTTIHIIITYVLVVY